MISFETKAVEKTVAKVDGIFFKLIGISIPFSANPTSISTLYVPSSPKYSK
jgi:hypothetical protein